MVETLRHTELALGQEAKSGEIHEFLDRVREHYCAANEPIDTTNIDLRWFQERDLLKPLVLHFGANPQQVFNALFEQHSQLPHDGKVITPPIDKPLLNSEEILSDEDFQRRFSQRVNEIADAIDSTQEFPALGKAARAIARYKAGFRFHSTSGRKHPEMHKNWLRKKLWGMRKRQERAEKRANNWLLKTKFNDMQSIVGHYADIGDTACCLLSSDLDALVPALILGNIEREGTIYVASRAIDTREQLFESFMSRLVDPEQLKGMRFSRWGLSRRKHRSALEGNAFIPESFRKPAGKFLARRFKDEHWYQQAYVLEGSRLPDEFYLFWNIIPVNSSHNQALAALDRESLNTLVVDRATQSIPESEKLSALWAADRALRVGGHMIFYEQANQQATVEYYGSELFAQKYQRIGPGDIHHPGLWVIYQKKSNDFDPSIISLEPTPLAVTISDENSIDEAPGERDAKKEEEKETEKPEEDFLQPPSLPVRAPKGKKEFYSVKDIAKKADVFTSDVRRRVQEIGIKMNVYPRMKKTRGKRYTRSLFTYEETQIILSGLEGHKKKSSEKREQREKTPREDEIIPSNLEEGGIEEKEATK